MATLATGAAAADVLVDACIALGKTEVLWAEGLPRLEQVGAAAPAMQRLLARILGGYLPTLAPEVMQVRYACERGGLRLI